MNDWANIIELICDKLGIVVDSALELVPEIVRYNIAVKGTVVGMSFLSFVVGVLLMRWGFKWALNKAKTESGDDDWVYYFDRFEVLASFICGAIVGFFGLILLIVSLPDFVGWLAAPNIKAIEWAVSLVS